MNSECQTLDIIKKHPGLCGEEIGARCKPGIQVNTVLKNISHIRDEYGDGCIRTEMVTGKNAGVEYATYYWQGIGTTQKTEEKIAEYRKIQATYPGNHRQREAIDQQIENLRRKQAEKGARKPDRAENAG